MREQSKRAGIRKRHAERLRWLLSQRALTVTVADKDGRVLDHQIITGDTGLGCKDIDSLMLHSRVLSPDDR